MSDKAKDKSIPLKETRYAANSTIFDEGEKGDASYIIRSGKVEIRKGARSANPVSLAELGKGDMFGEMALFDDRPRMASAIALTDVEVIQMPREDFLERLSTIDPTMKGMVLAMVARVRKMADEFMRRKGELKWAKMEKLE